ncbi:phosphatidylinositol/phosphatidylglycerol transfer protein [Hypoxylon trugodes]|uniref:phosphatidylinositol/phosphatidylglycerol transfer protein n=1 Tax=Hypoxylon trugodes TaxID=326681 RepID=UPI00218D00E6|nr:phosphatidylinositol/phosphatidylglycerol transfer protein [Hypoxylon trugodes]KAI1386335.1 phosphatidylinositol/phosphatidylglycerol transfer protein [Hypoxylon trugodes]
MRVSTVCAAALSVGFASAGSWFGGSQEIVTKDVEKVPGDSPLEFCDTDHSNDIIKIESVDLSPNPPETGAELVIKATGTVYETIQDGAKVNLVVKYGLIRLISTTADLCEQVENVDLKCPIEKGVLSLTKAVEIPKEVPPGTYNVYAEVINYDGKPVTCLQATVKFGGSKADMGDL